MKATGRNNCERRQVEESLGTDMRKSVVNQDPNYRRGKESVRRLGHDFRSEQQYSRHLHQQGKTSNAQLEVPFRRSEKSSGLQVSVKQSILGGERKGQSPKEFQCLGVRNNERSPGAERSKS